MKDKGFTLIELLAVIVILAIILLIAVPQVLSVIEDVKNNAYISTNDLVVEAAELYMASNIDELPSEIGNTSIVELASDLLVSGYIDEVNSMDNSCSGYVMVTKIDENNYSYIPHINCSETIVTNPNDDGLVAYYKLDSKSNLMDFTGNNAAGTLIGGLTLGGVANQKGEANSATYFDGIDDYIDLGTVTADWSNQTIMLWGKDYFSIEDIDDDQTFEFAACSTEIAYNIEDEVDGNDDFISASHELDSIWQLITATYDGTNYHLYINGELINYKIRGTLIVGSNPNLVLNKLSSLGGVESIIMGADGNFYLEGTISEVRLYNRALTELEIKEIYLATK